MKKTLVLVLGLVLVLATSSLAFAEGITVSGGYLFGNAKLVDGNIDGKAGGFMFSGEAPVYGPFGAAANVAFLKATELADSFGGTYYDVSLTRMDFLGTYALPFEGAALKAVAGYSISTVKFDVAGAVNSTVKGFLVGAAGSFVPMDKLAVSGSFGFGIGMKGEDEGVAGDYEMGLVSYKFGAAYQVVDNISVEGGYTASTYTNKENQDVDVLQLSGFFLGARASF